MRYRLGSIVIILLAMLIRAQRVDELGTQNDEGLHITIAERLVEGDVLYRDLFENRTPGVELVLAVAFRMAEPSILLARFLTLGVVTLTMAALILSGRLSQRLIWIADARHWGRSDLAGWAAGLLFALAPLAIFWSRFTMLEHWQTAAAAMAVAAALLAVYRESLAWWLASGFLAGLAILAKQSGLVVTGVLLLYLLLLQFRPAIANPRRALAYWLGGLVTPIAVSLVWLALQGALDDFFYLLSAADRLAPFSDLANKGGNLTGWIVRRPLVILSLVGAFAIFRSRSVASWLPLLWAAAEILALLTPRELDFGWGGFSHYALPVLAATSLLGGIGLYQFGLWLRGRRAQRALAAGVLVLMIAMISGWLADLTFAIAGSDYPSPTADDELRIGQAAAAITSEDEPIMVLGNAVFHHHSGRRPANRYFILPGYLPNSRLWPDAEAEMLNTLDEGDVAAIIVSRRYLEDRLSPNLREALWQDWVPAALFSYAYQGDAFMYLPRESAPSGSNEPNAVFEPGINLIHVDLLDVGRDALLVGLYWAAESRPELELIAFVHLLDDDDNLVAQHDGIPGVGFRPTSTWNPGEIIADWHWIELPEETGVSSLRIGLYDAVTGERRRLQDAKHAGDSVTLDLTGELR
ncbi:MAG: glycosyltransferase family 39 protein [Chloroflexota bacterium]|nr:MAG: glycosyltransferase family 39 protein [Chloroflexota bacterium]